MLLPPYCMPGDYKYPDDNVPYYNIYGDQTGIFKAKGQASILEERYT